MVADTHKAPSSLEAFYIEWKGKIRTTVRGNSQISIHEVDDVVQIIFMTCLQKKWLDQYNGSTAFSTFIYTYVLQEIQNYINKRNSSNTVLSTGVTRYTSFSALPVEDSAIDNFIDHAVFIHGGDTVSAGDLALDLSEFKKYAEERKIFTLCRDISCLEVIGYRLKYSLTGEDVKYSDKQKDADILAITGISIFDLRKIDECLKILLKQGVEAAIDYLEEHFFV